MKLEAASLSANLQAKSTDFNSVITLEKQQIIVVEPEITPDRSRSSVGTIFGSTFLTIFLAELGDKTQLATLLMSAESKSPGVVFLGASTALVATSLLGVMLGRWVARRFTPKTIEIAAGISLLLISATLLWDVIRS